MALQQLNDSISWSESYTFTDAGTRSYVFLTEGTYAEKNISLNLTVPSASPSLTGGAITGTATATGSACSISDNTNNSGVSITTAAAATRANVTYDGAINGWVSKSNGATAFSGDTTNLTAKTYYVNGVTINKPASGTRTFTITVPNGTGTITFTFNVDASGNTTIT